MGLGILKQKKEIGRYKHFPRGSDTHSSTSNLFLFFLQRPQPIIILNPSTLNKEMCTNHYMQSLPLKPSLP